VQALASAADVKMAATTAKIVIGFMMIVLRRDFYGVKYLEKGCY
jgi:hypothetical protein